MKSHLAWLDSAGHYLGAAAAYEQLCGVSVGQLARQALSNLHPEGTVEVLLRLLAQAQQQGQASATVQLFESYERYHCQLIWQVDAAQGLLLIEPAECRTTQAQQAAEQTPRLKTALDRDITQARLSQQQTALIKINLSGFMQMQALWGASLMDEVLTIATTRLLGALRGQDHLYRAAEDCLMVQLTSVADTDAALRVANRLQQVLAQPFHSGVREIHLETRLGVALAPLQATTAAQLLGAVNQAMKAAHSRQSIRLYDPLRQRKVLPFEVLSSVLAPETLPLSFQYRPIYGVLSHRMEAAQLVPVLKDTLCVGDDEHLLSENVALEAYVTQVFTTLAGAVEPLSKHKGFQGVVVRIAPAFVESPVFVSTMASAVCAEQVRHWVLLELDAIETRDYEGVLFDLEALGYRVVLRGFGDYQPPLQQLKELEPAWLQIDDAQTQAMAADSKVAREVEQLADMAFDLNIPLLAVGVRSAGQRVALAQQGVRYMQGSYFGGVLSLELLFEQLKMENI